VHHFHTVSVSNSGNLQSSGGFTARNISRLSANYRRSERCILTHKWLPNKLNKIAPNVEPCGSPEGVGNGEENFTTVRAKENLEDK
jgi:hypothetical protein